MTAAPVPPASHASSWRVRHERPPAHGRAAPAVAGAGFRRAALHERAGGRNVPGERQHHRARGTEWGTYAEPFRASCAFLRAPGGVVHSQDPTQERGMRKILTSIVFF